MKRFADFVKVDPNHFENINPYSMVHGSHAQRKNVEDVNINPYDMVHGSHAHKKPTEEIKESHDQLPRISEWRNIHDNSHISPDTDDLNTKLTEQRGGKDLLTSNPNYDSLDNYTNSSFGLNDHLRDARMRGETPRDSVGGVRIENLDKLIGEHSSPYNIKVYQGTRFHPLELAQQHPTKLEYLNPGFTSTSISKRTALNFSTDPRPSTEKDGVVHHHVLSIDVPKGHPGLYVGPNSWAPAEREFLIPRNTTFTLKSATPQMYYSPPHSMQFKGHGGELLHVWHADIAPPPNPATADYDTVDKVMHGTDSDLKIKMLQHSPEIKPHHISMGLDDPNYLVQAAAIQHPTAVRGHHITKVLGTNNPNTRADSEVVRVIALHHPQTTPTHVASVLMNDPSHNVKQAAMRSPHAKEAMDMAIKMSQEYGEQ